ncbi:MAG TPA: hypothetical protein VNY05_15060 [Candidatus Acidoferrales bacterium]|jgi:hypothetical protein|nr:hypothetical protein [Candidatus Acidoferrales bacterium]
MSRTRVICGVFAAAVGLFAQGGGLTVSSPSWKGLEIHFETKIEPPGTLLPGGVISGPDSAHHIINDAAHRRAFGYNIGLDPDQNGQTAQIRIERWNPAESKVTFHAGWTFLELPKYPLIPNVRVGETVALDLLVNSSTGQKVVDYLTLRRHGDMDLRSASHDFAVADAELMLAEPRLFLNGKLEAEDSAGVSGTVIWLYLMGHGRFVLSLIPHDKLGFVRNGVVSRNGLLFRDRGVEFRVECDSRIAPGSGTYNLYVREEREWRPDGGAPFRIGSADSAELVVGKK